MKIKSLAENGASSVLSFFVPFVPLWFILVLSGCASAPIAKAPGEDARLQSLLDQAAQKFTAPNAPKAMDLLDDAQVEWRPDKSMRVTVHQLWAARVKPEHPLPLLASLNQDSQTLSIQTLKLYELDPKGGFVPAEKQPQAQWIPPQENLPLSLSNITSVRLPELQAGQALEVKYVLETKTSSLLIGKDMHNDPKKPHPVAPEAGFAFRWNDYTPSLQRDLVLKIPANLELFGARLRLPKEFVADEPTVPKGKEKTAHFPWAPRIPFLMKTSNPPSRTWPPSPPLPPIGAGKKPPFPTARGWFSTWTAT